MKHIRRLLGLPHLTAAFLLATVVACARTPGETASDILSDHDSTRASAASSLEDDAEDIPPIVVDALLYAAPREKNEDTRGDMMLSLARSGDPRAKAVLDVYAGTYDADERETAAKALQIYAVATGRYAQDYEFPEDWPYGTEGYPPKLD